MKKIFLLILVCVLSLAGVSQPIVNRSNSQITVQDGRWAAQYNLFVPRFQDTASANTQKGIDTCGALIYVYNTQGYWFRSCTSTGKKWVQLSIFALTNGSGTTANGTAVDLGGSLTSAENIDGGGNYYLAIRNARFQVAKGANVVAANNLDLGRDGNLFHITGSTQINAIITTDWNQGSIIGLTFQDAPLLKHNGTSPIGTKPMRLSGQTDFQASNGDYISFQFDGDNWYEIGRSLAGSAPNAVRFGVSGEDDIFNENREVDGQSTYQMVFSNVKSFQFYANDNASSDIQLVTDWSTQHWRLTNNNNGVTEAAIYSNMGGANGIYPEIGLVASTSTPSLGYGQLGFTRVILTPTKIRLRPASSSDTLQFDNIPSVVDTTNYKPTVINVTGTGGSLGQIKQFNSWGEIGLGTNIYNSDGTLTGARTMTMSTNPLTFSSANVTGTTTSSSLVLTANSLTSGSGLYASSTSLSSGSLIDVSVNSTAAASNTQKGINVAMSGANGTSGQTTYGIFSSNAHSGTNSVNYGVYGTVSNAGLSGAGVYGFSSSFVGVRGESSSTYGVLGISSSASGGQFSSVTGAGVESVTTGTHLFDGTATPSSTSTVHSTVRLSRGTSGTAADGIGQSIDIYIETATNDSRLANQLISKFTTAADATRTSQFIITGVNSTTTRNLLTLDGNGLMTLGVAGTNLGSMALAGNTSGAVTIQPAAAAGTWTMTLPTNDGDANQVLTTNGSGVTSWGNAITSGTYTPTITNVANVSASTGYDLQYLQVGNTVTVSGKIDIDPTVTLTETRIGISLPIASDIANDYEIGGSGFASTIASDGFAIRGDATNNRAEIIFNCTDVTNHSYFFSFTYKVTVP